METTTQAPSVWCPLCEAEVKASAFLAKRFRDQPAIRHAASLVTHGRNNHCPAWEAGEAKLPTANNQVKRTLLRSIAKHHRQGTLPEGLDAGALCRAFLELWDTDQKTVETVERVVSRIL